MLEIIKINKYNNIKKRIISLNAIFYYVMKNCHTIIKLYILIYIKEICYG